MQISWLNAHWVFEHVVPNNRFRLTISERAERGGGAMSICDADDELIAFVRPTDESYSNLLPNLETFLIAK